LKVNLLQPSWRKSTKRDGHPFGYFSQIAKGGTLDDQKTFFDEFELIL
jgi:hypothetical protein